jgi:uncharacterized protein YjbI with pentapeptide repeats
MRPDPPDLPPEPEPPDLEAVRIVEARLEDVSLAEQRRPGLALLDCELRECDLANLDARGGVWRRVAVRGGRLTGCNLGEATLCDVDFEGCRADLVALTAGKLERVRFAGCELSQLDLQEARLRGALFEDCDLRGADLSGARFEDVELRGCRLEGVRGAGALRGVRMPWADVLENAAVFAGACGIEILD